MKEAEDTRLRDIHGGFMQRLVNFVCAESVYNVPRDSAAGVVNVGPLNEVGSPVRPEVGLPGRMPLVG